ncbi:uncharacterized protein PG998_013588 [Apiospora kogelbergensis]|uniref:DinB superfamily protein n=1 Tax=Apiospora kogelbergensis TaxID=1337665 RepID=A0AAW0R0Y4_9PEZI
MCCFCTAPIFDRVDIPSAPNQINGTLADEQASIWRQPPSPAADAAWDRITKVGYHTVTSEDIRRLGKDPATTVRAPADWDLGDDAHLVQLDLAHQLHCLNVLRKAAHPDYYGVGRALLRGVHTAHCVDVLLQNLLCDASVDVYTHNWVETQRHPFPDMSLNRQCRDFEAVLAWHHKTLIPWNSEIPRPAGAVILPMAPKLREHWSKFQTDELHN